MGAEGRSARRTVLWVAALAIAVVAAYLMLAPTPRGAETIPPLAAHVLLFSAQTLVTIAAAVGDRGRRIGTTRTAVLAMVAVAIYATALELGQAAVPGRETEAADLIANFAGAGAGFGAWRLLLARPPR